MKFGITLGQSEYMALQVKDGISAHGMHGIKTSFDLLFRDLNIDEALIHNQLQHLLEPIIQNNCNQITSLNVHVII